MMLEEARIKKEEFHLDRCSQSSHLIFPSLAHVSQDGIVVALFLEHAIVSCLLYILRRRMIETFPDRKKASKCV